MRIKSFFVLGITFIAALALVPPLAQAAEATPTTRELLDKCNRGTDSCVFHPSSRKEFPGRREQVGRTVQNCTTTNQNQMVAWADSTGGSNSIGISITETMEFAKVFSIGVTVTYSRSWDWSHTTTRTDNLSTPPYNVGQIFHAPSMQTVTGTYELHFGKKFYNHYIWYVNNFSATGPMDNDGSVTFYARPMTSDERKRCPH